MGKIGRNDDCPCGSGKKYKRCCLGNEVSLPEPERSPPARPSTARRASQDQGSRDLEAFRRAVETLQEMLEGGVLEDLRFDPERFAAATERHLDAALRQAQRHAKREGRREWEYLMDLCHPELSDLAWRERAERALLAAVPATSRHSRQHIVLELALAIGRSQPEGEKVPGLLFMALFPIQLREMGSTQVALNRTMRDLARKVAAGEITSDDIISSASPAIDEAVALVARLPHLHTRLADQAHEAVARAVAALEGPHPPPLLTLDMFLWFNTQVKLLRPGDAGREQLDAIASQLSDELRRYCMSQLKSAQGGTRELWGDLLSGVVLDPLRLIIAATLNRDLVVVSRPADTDFTGVDWREPGGMETNLTRYEAVLRERGDTVAADRVGWTRVALGPSLNEWSELRAET